jgi:hypothetical protein
VKTHRRRPIYMSRQNLVCNAINLTCHYYCYFWTYLHLFKFHYIFIIFCLFRETWQSDIHSARLDCRRSTRLLRVRTPSIPAPQGGWRHAQFWRCYTPVHHYDATVLLQFVIPLEVSRQDDNRRFHRICKYNYMHIIILLYVTIIIVKWKLIMYHTYIIRRID